MSTTIIRLEPSKTKQRVQIINDALPGIILLFTGLSALVDRGFTQAIMPYVDVIVGIVVVRTALMELRRNDDHKKINLFDIAAGCVILIESGTMYKPYKGFQPAHLLFLVGVLTIVRGVFADKIPRLRRIVLSDDGIFARTSLLHRLSCSWTDLLRISPLNSAIEFVQNNQTKRLNLRRVENRTEIIEKIVEAAKERGIKVERAD